MVKVRLHRTGAKKRPSYRIVAIDSRKKRQGRVLELLGTYDPIRDSAVTLRLDAFERWVAKGAQVSDTVNSLVKRQKLQGEAAETGA